jgi:anthranilate synthase/aminodeoxychorismate synthase-like glutamine amidotransferase
VKGCFDVNRSRVLLIDNHDSFTWNLAQALAVLGAEVDVVLSDRVSGVDSIALRFDAVVISPGPGRPEDAGSSVPVILACAGRLPVLGVCLGHQAIAQAYGASIVRANELVHGKTSPVVHDGCGVFAGLPSPFDATRYHSLTVDPATVPPELSVCAEAPDGTIMGLRHRRSPTHGVQFHPESVLTPLGGRLLANFLAETRAHAGAAR